jgi:hypothetical protein
LIADFYEGKQAFAVLMTGDGYMGHHPEKGCNPNNQNRMTGVFIEST